MRYIEVGSDRFEFNEGTFTVVRDDMTESLPESSVEVAPTAATAFFPETRMFISMSTREWAYLRGLVDSVEEVASESVAEEAAAEAVSEVVAPVAASRRGRRKA